jgi:hypothetical protein
MLSKNYRTWLVAGGFMVAAVIVTIGLAIGASVSTTVFLVALGVAPGIVIALLKGGASAPTVAEILHPVNPREGRL